MHTLTDFRSLLQLLWKFSAVLVLCEAYILHTGANAIYIPVQFVWLSVLWSPRIMYCIIGSH